MPFAVKWSGQLLASQFVVVGHFLKILMNFFKKIVDVQRQIWKIKFRKIVKIKILKRKKFHSKLVFS